MTTPKVTEVPITHGHTSYSLAAAREGRSMNSDEQRADRWERIEAAKAHEPQPCVCAGTGNHDGQGIEDCDECNPAKYEHLA